jgi:hypothetical protein
MVKSDKIANAFKRSEVHRKGKRDKEQEKLKRRMETRKAEAGEGGEELKRVRSISIIVLFDLSTLNRSKIKGKKREWLMNSND